MSILKKLLHFLKWWWAPPNYAASTINRNPIMRRMQTSLHFFFLVMWMFWVGQDLIHHRTVIFDLIFLAHRAWCAWRWYKYLRDNDDDDDSDKGTPIPVWRSVLIGA